MQNKDIQVFQNTEMHLVAEEDDVNQTPQGSWNPGLPAYENERLLSCLYKWNCAILYTLKKADTKLDSKETKQNNREF